MKEEEEDLAQKNAKSQQFSERLLNPTAGSRNLLKCLEKSKNPVESTSSSIISSPVTIKSITAKDLILEHKQKLQVMKAAQNKTVLPPLQSSPQLGRGLAHDQNEIDLSIEVLNYF